MGGEFVFEVEVGGDDEVAVVIESLEGLVEDFGPDGFVVPVVLVAEEDEVGLVDELEVIELVGALGEEMGVGFGEFVLPAFLGGVDLGGTDVEAEDGVFLALGAEDLGEDFGLIGASTGEVEEGEVFLFREVGGDDLGEVIFQN